MHPSTETAPAPPAALLPKVKQKEKEKGKGDDRHPKRLVPLGDYRSPGMPAEHVVRAVWRRIKQRFEASDTDPVRAENRLQATTMKALDEVVGPPACGPLLDDFDAAVRAWLDEPGGTFHCVVVLPPCDSTDLIGTWAQSRGHAVLCAPVRDQGHALSVIAGTDQDAQAEDGENGGNGGKGGALTLKGDAPLLVIPRLESWFLRRRNGLGAVRALLAELQQSERRCLIGCNSWAWAFLVRAAGAALVLPSPRTFAAFDARRLQAWFAELAAQMQTQSGRVTFRLASSGANVLETKDDGALTSNYLEELAARSNGIPWVAWHLWRNALRTGIDAIEAQKANENANADGRKAGSHKVAQANTNVQAEAGAGKALPVGDPGGERTFWIAGVPDPDLPHHHDENALLVLHALLIHGPLARDELLSVLPDATAAEVLPALLRAGFIEQREDRLAVLPSAYPALRRALLADGFPVGDI